MEKKFTLPREFGKKWIVALRSGEYVQSAGELKTEWETGDCFCANGVGYNANGFKIKHGCRIVIGNKSFSGFNITGNLPISNDLFEYIIELNDRKKHSFPEIADWIEQNVNLI